MDLPFQGFLAIVIAGAGIFYAFSEYGKTKRFARPIGIVFVAAFFAALVGDPTMITEDAAGIVTQGWDWAREKAQIDG